MDNMNQTQQGQQENTTPVQEPSGGNPAKQSTSGLAIAGLVLGILSIATSFLPIINNASFLLAIIGLVLAIVGLVGINKGKHTGKGLAVAGIVLGVLSIVFVLATQALFSATLDAMRNGPAVASQSAASTAAPASSAAASQESSGAGEQQADIDYQNLPVGTDITLKNGMSITVNSIEGGLAQYDGSEIIRVTITYANNGTKNGSFNAYDWQAEDADGALRRPTFYMDSENELNSGKLSPGGQVTGNVYFDAPVAKVHYFGSIVDDTSTAAWVA